MDNNGEAVTSVVLTVTLRPSEGKDGNGIFSRCQFIDTQQPESLLLEEEQKGQMVPWLPLSLCDRILWIACVRETGRALVENKSDHESLLCAKITQQADELERLRLERDAFRLRAQIAHLTTYPLHMLMETPPIASEHLDSRGKGETLPGALYMGLGKDGSSDAETGSPEHCAETGQGLKQQLVNAQQQQLLGMSRTPSAMSDATVRHADYHPHRLQSSNNSNSGIHPHSPSASRRPVTSLSGNRVKFVPVAQRMKTHSSTLKQQRQQEEHEAMLTAYLRELEVMNMETCVVCVGSGFKGWRLDLPQAPVALITVLFFPSIYPSPSSSFRYSSWIASPLSTSPPPRFSFTYFISRHRMQHSGERASVVFI